MPLSQGKVKSVLSGDTLVLCAVNDPRQERILSLAYVNAPRLKRDGDEPFAFQSRDYIRRLLVGKIVQFNTLYTIPTGAKREYGRVFLQTGEVLPDLSLGEGWLRLRDDAARRAEESDELRDLLENYKTLQDQARSSNKGTWSSSPDAIRTSYDIADSQAFITQWKGKPVDAVVEKVITGDRIIARLMLSPTEHVQTMVLVAGVRAPATARAAPSESGQQAPPLTAEPFGAEAQQFVDMRLMQRTVKVEALGLTPQGGLICNVVHPNGSIAEFLLQAGLARCNDHHSAFVGSNMASLRKAEKSARDSRIGVHKGATVKANAKESDATVTRVQTADTVFLRTKDGEEKRVGLSSIRQPKPTDPKQAPFSADAKEFVRRKLIGKHVKVILDGRKEANEGFEARDMVSLVLGGKNIAIQIVESGHASVVRHRQDADDKSHAYDDLMAAEAEAQAAKKGMWAAKPPPTKTYQDYSESLQKAKVQSSVLQRQKRIPAIVDYVKGASRFVLLIPRENAKLTFVLSGIRAPRSARNEHEKSEPFGQEAHDFANRRCMQRDVEVDVEGTDKVGGFIGTMYLNRENFARLLVEDGLASVHAYSAEQSGNGNELFAAEDRAKKEKRGLWHDYDPTITDGVEDLSLAGTQANGTNPTDASDASAKKDYRDATVTHIDPATMHVKLQVVSTATTGALISLMSSFKAHHRSPPSSERSLPGPPKAGDYVSACFSVDKEWYRGRIRRNDREAEKADILFIDYGNNETIPWSELRPLNPTMFGVQKLRAQAIDAGLSYIQFPTSPEYLSEAVNLLQDLTDGKNLVASVDHEEKDSSTIWVTLFDTGKSANEEDSVNAAVVEEGLAMTARKLRPWEARHGPARILPGLRKKEELAKQEKRGMWEYGDISDD